MPLIGQRIIIRTNESEPLICGTLVRFHQYPHHSSAIPVVKPDNSGDEVMCMGPIFPHSEPLMRMLEPLPPKEQYKLLAGIQSFLFDLDHCRSHPSK